MRGGQLGGLGVYLNVRWSVDRRDKSPQGAWISSADSSRAMPTVRLENTELHYELSGTGPRLLILSPSNTALRDMKPYFSSYSQLTSKFCCLFFDHRGTGASGMPNEQWPDPSMTVLANDTLAVLDAVGWESCHVLGLSFGGMVAQELVIARPSVVESLLLVCTSAAVGVEVHCSYPLETLLNLSAEERSESLLLLADVRRDRGWLASSEGSGAMEFVLRADAQVERSAGASAGRRWQLRARATHDAVRRLRSALVKPERTVRTAVFGAVHDGLTPPAAASQLSSALGPADAAGGPVWFNTGHWPNLIREEPAKFVRAVEHFVKHGALASETKLESSHLEAAIDWSRSSSTRDCCVLTQPECCIL